PPPEPALLPAYSVPGRPPATHTPPAPAAFPQSYSSQQCPPRPQNTSGECPTPRPAAFAPGSRCSPLAPPPQNRPLLSPAVAASYPWRHPAPGCAPLATLLEP